MRILPLRSAPTGCRCCRVPRPDSVAGLDVSCFGTKSVLGSHLCAVSERMYSGPQSRCVRRARSASYRLAVIALMMRKQISYCITNEDTRLKSCCKARSSGRPSVQPTLLLESLGIRPAAVPVRTCRRFGIFTEADLAQLMAAKHVQATVPTDSRNFRKLSQYICFSVPPTTTRRLIFDSCVLASWRVASFRPGYIARVSAPAAVPANVRTSRTRTRKPFRQRSRCSSECREGNARNQQPDPVI